MTDKAKRRITFIGLIILLLISLFAPRVYSQCQALSGAAVIAQDSNNTFLGVIDNRYASDSIFNEYGSYGSAYGSTSVFNIYSRYGSDFSSYSAQSETATQPPVIIKNGQVIGYLSANRNLTNSIHPNTLKQACQDRL